MAGASSSSPVSGGTKILIDHPELESFCAGNLRAIAAPDHRERDPIYEDRLRYYASDAGRSRWLLVVVSYEQAPARIVSAFGVRKDPKSWNA